MTAEGPLLEALTRRVADAPGEFVGDLKDVTIGAILIDTLVKLGAGLPPVKDAGVLAPKADNAKRVALVACWLLHDPWFISRKTFSVPARVFLVQDVPALAAIVQAPKVVSDPDRREELARLCLKALGLRPQGEDDAQADDRLKSISTVERQRVIAKAREAEERARKVRHEMAEKAAREAAAKISRE